MSEYDNFDDEFLDEDEQAEYNKKYLAEVNRSAAGLKDHEKDEVVEEFNARHNFKRSDDPAADARRNFLEAKDHVRNVQENQDPHLAALMQNIDKEKGQGAARKMLKKSYESDSSYFDPETNPNIRGLK